MKLNKAELAHTHYILSSCRCGSNNLTCSEDETMMGVTNYTISCDECTFKMTHTNEETLRLEWNWRSSLATENMELRATMARMTTKPEHIAKLALLESVLRMGGYNPDDIYHLPIFCTTCGALIRPEDPGCKSCQTISSLQERIRNLQCNQRP